MAVSEAIENYLETIYILSLRQNEVHAIDICSYLSYSRPTVSIVLRQMRENGLVTVNDDNHIFLTDEGRARAEAVIADKERFEHDAFSCLGPGELDELLGLLDRLHDHWEQLKRNEDERGDTVWPKN